MNDTADHGGPWERQGIRRYYANLTESSVHSTCSTKHFKYSVSGIAQW